jgi:hypothetical protein
MNGGIPEFLLVAESENINFKHFIEKSAGQVPWHC